MLLELQLQDTIYEHVVCEVFFLCIFKIVLYVSMAQRLVLVDKKSATVCEVFSLEHVVCEVFCSLHI
jgi:hypothetical protein